jgi:hypothetical protein
VQEYAGVFDAAEKQGSCRLRWMTLALNSCVSQSAASHNARSPVPSTQRFKSFEYSGQQQGS